MKHRLFRRIFPRDAAGVDETTDKLCQNKGMDGGQAFENEWEDPTFCGTADGSFRNPPFAHQLILGKISDYLQGFNSCPGGWFGISEPSTVFF